MGLGVQGFPRLVRNRADSLACRLTGTPPKCLPGMRSLHGDALSHRLVAKHHGGVINRLGALVTAQMLIATVR